MHYSPLSINLPFLIVTLTQLLISVGINDNKYNNSRNCGLRIIYNEILSLYTPLAETLLVLTITTLFT